MNVFFTNCTDIIITEWLKFENEIISKLWYNGVLHDRDMDIIIKETESRKSRENLIEIMKGKEITQLKMFVNVVAESLKEKDDVVDKLKLEFNKVTPGRFRYDVKQAGTNGYLNPSVAAHSLPNFILSSPRILRMREIIMQDPNALIHWNTVKDDFVRRPVDNLAISKMELPEAIKRSLEVWLSNKASEATFQSCIAILSKHGLNALARALEDKGTEIQNVR